MIKNPRVGGQCWAVVRGPDSVRRPARVLILNKSRPRFAKNSVLVQWVELPTANTMWISSQRLFDDHEEAARYAALRALGAP